MAMFGGIGRAMGGAMKAPAKQMLPKQQPKQGIGPSPAMGGGIGGMMQKMKPPMNQAVQSAGNAVGAAFGKPAPQQMGNFQLNPGVDAANTFGGSNMRAMQPPMMGIGPMRPPAMNVPEPSAAPASPVYDDQNTPEMMDLKRQQMEAMNPGPMNQIARPQMQQERPDEAIDAYRRNKFSQMRPQMGRGIGPRFGGGGPMQY